MLEGSGGVVGEAVDVEQLGDELAAGVYIFTLNSVRTYLAILRLTMR